MVHFHSVSLPLSVVTLLSSNNRTAFGTLFPSLTCPSLCSCTPRCLPTSPPSRRPLLLAVAAKPTAEAVRRAVFARCAVSQASRCARAAPKWDTAPKNTRSAETTQQPVSAVQGCLDRDSLAQLVNPSVLRGVLLCVSVNTGRSTSRCARKRSDSLQAHTTTHGLSPLRPARRAQCAYLNNALIVCSPCCNVLSCAVSCCAVLHVQHKLLAASTSSTASSSSSLQSVSGAKEEIVVTWQDQQSINAFSRLNTRLSVLDDMLKQLGKEHAGVVDAADSIDMLDDDSVMIKVGEVYVRVSNEEGEEWVEREKQAVEEKKSKMEAEKADIEKQMKELKATLYAKFGKAINLENAEQTINDD